MLCVLSCAYSDILFYRDASYPHVDLYTCVFLHQLQHVENMNSARISSIMALGRCIKSRKEKCRTRIVSVHNLHLRSCLPIGMNDEVLFPATQTQSMMSSLRINISLRRLRRTTPHLCQVIQHLLLGLRGQCLPNVGVHTTDLEERRPNKRIEQRSTRRYMA